MAKNLKELKTALQIPCSNRVLFSPLPSSSLPFIFSSLLHQSLFIRSFITISPISPAIYCWKTDRSTHYLHKFSVGFSVPKRPVWAPSQRASSNQIFSCPPPCHQSTSVFRPTGHWVSLFPQKVAHSGLHEPPSTWKLPAAPSRKHHFLSLDVFPEVSNTM